METFSFEKLLAYQKARILVKGIYALMRKYPKEEIYALCNQMRRAAISVSSNIAEGIGRSSIKEQIHFIEISYGSLMELYSQLEVSLDLEYITLEEFSEHKVLILDLAKMLSKLRFIRTEKLKSETNG